MTDADSSVGQPASGETLRQYQQWVDSVPAALIPYYVQTRADQDIGLYRGPISAIGKTYTSAMDGLVRLRWRPHPRVECIASGKIDSAARLMAFGQDDGELQVPAVLARVPDQVMDIRFRSSQKPWTTTLTGDINTPSIKARRFLSRVVFHVVNFTDLHGTLIRNSRSVNPDRLVFDAEPWRITLDSRLSDEKFKKSLEDAGSYAITHVGEVRRLDGRSFLPKDALEVIESFNYYLWLGKGGICAPILPVGFDAKAAPIWTEWNIPFIDAMASPIVWLDDHYAAHYEASFGSFRARWGDPYWREVLRLALRYYLKANQPDPVQAGIVMGQIALELLAWAVLVVDRRQVTRRQWRDLHADDKIRRLLKHFAIPASLPAELSDLVGVAGKNSWTDGPEAVAALRNQVVHLKRPRADHQMKVWVDVWLLTTHYVELAILALIGYQGVYKSRLSRNRWAGAVEPVPWAESDPLAALI